MKILLWQKAECRAVEVRGYMWVEELDLYCRHEIEIMVTWGKNDIGIRYIQR